MRRKELNYIKELSHIVSMTMIQFNNSKMGQFVRHRTDEDGE